MKKSVLLITCMIAGTVLASAQSIIKDETLLGKEKTRITAYGASSTNFTRINGSGAVFTGAYGGILLNHKLMIGLGGYGLVTEHTGFDSEGNKDQDNELKMGYGGIVAEYIFLSQKRIHATTHILVGAGAAVNGHRSRYADSNGDYFRSEDESGFTVIEPSVSVEANMTNWFRISVGAGYRFVNGLEMVGLSDSKLSAPTMNLSLKFGKF